MQRLVFLIALLAPGIFPLVGSAQGPSVQLCVATMQMSGSNDTSPEGRDMLIKSLSKEKIRGSPLKAYLFTQHFPSKHWSPLNKKAAITW